jgi:hypothetical protein
MVKRLRIRANELRSAANQKHDEKNPPGDPKIIEMMLEVAEDLDAEADQQELERREASAKISSQTK